MSSVFDIGRCTAKGAKNAKRRRQKALGIICVHQGLSAVFILKDDGFYKIKSRTEYPVCRSYPDGYECRYSVKGRALHVTHDNPNKVWLDVYPGIFNGSLLESYEVLIKGDKVESYRRDYPDVQTGFTVLRCCSTS